MPDTYTLTQASLSGLPCLFLGHENLKKSAPSIIVLHGLGSCKEKMLATLYHFAQIGCHAIAFDLRQHGALPGAEQRDLLLQSNYLPTITEIISGSVADISRLVAHLDSPRIGIHGISLGGYVTFGALLAEPRITAASVAMGSPDWLFQLRESGLRAGNPYYDAVAVSNPLDILPYVYPPRPLLMQHGDNDDIVPSAGVQALSDRLTPLYREFPENLVLKMYAGHGHYYSEQMQIRSAAWFRQHLLSLQGTPTI